MSGAVLFQSTNDFLEYVFGPLQHNAHVMDYERNKYLTNTLCEYEQRYQDMMEAARKSGMIK